MSSTTRTIDQLCISPWNVRKNEQDATATGALERSIVDRFRRGRPLLILPLVIHPMNKKMWGVYAGGRRYRSVKAAIERGDLPSDVSIDVVERDMSVAELIEDSTAENLLRRDLRDYEYYAAVANAHRYGDSPDKIADTLGQELRWVERALRLGNLAQPIFQALEEERISVDQARAYASTEDQALQLAAFELLDHLADFERTPAKIRAHLRVGDAEAARLLRFVTADAYVAAGGRLEPDLFADANVERNIVSDEPLLRKLTHEKLAGVRQSVRDRAGRPNLRFEKQPPTYDFGIDYTLRVDPREAADGTYQLPEGAVIAVIAIPEAGEPEVSFWWESRKAKHGTPKPPAAARARAAGASADRRATPPIGHAAALKEETGLGVEAIEILRSVRTAILRAALVDDANNDGTVAQDYLVWVQLRSALKGTFPALVGMRTIAPGRPGSESARAHIAAIEATKVWGAALHRLSQQRFITSDDLVEAYRDYRAADNDVKRVAAAVVAGMALERSLSAGEYRIPLHDAVADDVDLLVDEGVRQFWKPTAAMLDLLPKEERLKIAEPFVERASFAPWSRMKSGDVTSHVLAAVTGNSNVVRASRASEAAAWVHPLLRFTAMQPAQAAIADVNMQDAAA